MTKLGESEELKWVLAKPRYKPEVLVRDPLLKSTGKAGSGAYLQLPEIGVCEGHTESIE